jgi:hypothetical protein
MMQLPPQSDARFHVKLEDVEICGVVCSNRERERERERKREEK